MNENLAGWVAMLSGSLANAGGGGVVTERGALIDDAGDVLLTDTGERIVYTE